MCQGFRFSSCSLSSVILQLFVGSMAACADLTFATFPCLPSNFLGWSSLSYTLLPLNIAIYDLVQLYHFRCDCFNYHAPSFSNAFQTGIYSYILCILCLIHAFAALSCHGCSGALYMCHIDTISLNCLYLMLCMFSWTRLFCRFQIQQFQRVPSTSISKHSVDSTNNSSESGNPSRSGTSGSIWSRNSLSNAYNVQTVHTV